MNEELKPCPFCGSDDIVSLKTAYRDYHICNNCAAVCEETKIGIVAWNERPIEDALQTRAEKAEAERDEARAEAGRLRALLTAAEAVWSAVCEETKIGIVAWNERPIEDALQTRAEKAEAERDEARAEAGRLRALLTAAEAVWSAVCEETKIGIVAWNERPIEDALQTRAEKAEAEVTEHRRHIATVMQREAEQRQRAERAEAERDEARAEAGRLRALLTAAEAVCVWCDSELSADKFADVDWHKCGELMREYLRVKRDSIDAALSPAQAGKEDEG